MLRATATVKYQQYKKKKYYAIDYNVVQPKT